MQFIYQEKQLNEGVIYELGTAKSTSSTYQWFQRLIEEPKMGKKLVHIRINRNFLVHEYKGLKNNVCKEDKNFREINESKVLIESEGRLGGKISSNSL